MKKYTIKFIIFIILIIAAFYAGRTLSFDEKFKWSTEDSELESDAKTEDLKKLKFSNGMALIFQKTDPESTFGAKLLLQEKNSSSKVILEDDIVTINAVYPSRENAKIALISNNCSGNGSMCAVSPTYLVTEENSTAGIFFISQEPFKIEVDFKNKKLHSARANVVLATDPFGSNIYGDIQFLTGKGFVVPQMKTYYQDLWGKYPTDYFDHEIARATLGKTIGLTKFRDFRSHLDVAGENQLVKYRYLVLSGCMAHSCGDSHGLILIDTTNDDLWWIDEEDGKISSGSNREFSAAEIHRFNEVFEYVEWTEGTVLSIDRKGKLSVRINK